MIEFYQQVKFTFMVLSMECKSSIHSERPYMQEYVSNYPHTWKDIRVLLGVGPGPTSDLLLTMIPANMQDYGHRREEYGAPSLAS